MGVQLLGAKERVREEDQPAAHPTTPHARPHPLRLQHGITVGGAHTRFLCVMIRNSETNPT